MRTLKGPLKWEQKDGRVIAHVGDDPVPYVLRPGPDMVKRLANAIETRRAIARPLSHVGG